jgi:hypothetical protein
MTEFEDGRRAAARHRSRSKGHKAHEAPRARLTPRGTPHTMNDLPTLGVEGLPAACSGGLACTDTVRTPWRRDEAPPPPAASVPAAMPEAVPAAAPEAVPAAAAETSITGQALTPMIGPTMTTGTKAWSQG